MLKSGWCKSRVWGVWLLPFRLRAALSRWQHIFIGVRRTIGPLIPGGYLLHGPLLIAACIKSLYFIRPAPAHVCAGSS